MQLLEKLIRYHKFLLDEKRRVLKALQDEEARIETALHDLQKELVTEQAAARAAPEALYAYGSFARAAIDRRAALHDELVAAAAKVEAAREELAQAFEELKKYEITKDNRDRAEREELDRREQIELDEIASVGHRRRRLEGS
jgi:flagellar export protein FliJ